MCRVCAGFPANSVLTLRMRLGSSVSTGGRFGFAAHRAAELGDSRPAAIPQAFPPSGRGSFVRAPSGRFIGAAFGGGDCRVPPRGGLRFSAHRAAQFVGGRPTASSFLACPRKEPKKGTRGYAPATPAPPPVGLWPKSAAPCHGSMGGYAATRQPPRRGRNASAREPPEPYRGCFWGGTSAFAWRAAPTGRRKTARLCRAHAQSARTPGTGVVFRRGFWRAIRLQSLGAPAT